MAINLQELRQEIIKMTPRQKVYKTLKIELTKLGNWRNHPRGDPQAGYKARQAKMASGSTRLDYGAYGE